MIQYSGVCFERYDFEELTKPISTKQKEEEYGNLETCP
jgi:hypothetical protein